MRKMECYQEDAHVVLEKGNPKVRKGVLDSNKIVSTTTAAAA